MEWLTNNIVNVITALVLFSGGIAFAKQLDSRLNNIEKEQNEIKQVVVVSARLEERFTHLSQVVISQGRRLDRLTEHVLNKKSTVDDDE
jgi:hypothetical protein